MMRKSILKNITWWIGINALLGIIIPFFYASERYFKLEFSTLWDDMLYSFLMSCAISGSVGINETLLDRKLPWLSHPAKRFFTEIIGVSIFSFTAAFVVNVTFFGAFGLIDWENFPWQKIVKNCLTPLYISYGITAFFISRSFLLNWRDQAIKNEKARSERYRGQVQVLQDQLNPHFLFNSLNALTNLVYEDADRSSEYIRKLSQFYRYVLEVQNEDVVTLSREIEFARSYLELQQIRFGTDALQYELPKETPDSVIPPLVLQLLFENAIKHNKIEGENPLVLKVYTAGEMLVIENNLLKRSIAGESTGIGLNNIRERYNGLTDKKVDISSTDGMFRVKLPLLRTLKE